MGRGVGCVGGMWEGVRVVCAICGRGVCTMCMDLSSRTIPPIVIPNLFRDLIGRLREEKRQQRKEMLKRDAETSSA